MSSSLGEEDQFTEYGYDPNNNLTSQRDPLDRLTQHSFDALDRLQQTIDPILGEIDFAYDPQDNLVSVSDPRDVTTSYTYNGFDELSRLISPDTGVTDYDYDPAGNLIERTDARGVTAQYSHDAANRLSEIAYPAFDGLPAETLSFSYDDTSAGNAGLGRLTGMSDGSGSTALRYDSHGRLLAKTQTVGSGTPRTLATSYLPNARVEGHVLPSGAVVRYLYRADGRVLSITT
jgi:YD repeat-containing protein